MTTEFDACAYVDAAAPAMDLRIPADSRDAVVANLVRLEALARQVMGAEALMSPASRGVNET